MTEADAMSDFYVPDENKNPVPCRSVLEWGRSRQEHPERWLIGLDEIDGCIVSTMFLGIDHGFPWLASDSSAPVLWETMIWQRDPNAHMGREWLDYQERYSSVLDAEVGHQVAIEWVKRGEHKT